MLSILGTALYAIICFLLLVVVLMQQGNGGDAVSWRLVDPKTVYGVVKKLGDVVNRVELSVSNDGMVLTITENGTGPDGMPTHGVRVYDRQ